MIKYIPEKGDIIQWLDRLYTVIENNGSTGVVNPHGEGYYVRGFEWDYEGDPVKFIRKSTKYELEKLGL